MTARLPGQLPAISGAVVHARVIYTAGIVAPSVLAGTPTGIAEQAVEVLGCTRCTFEPGTVPPGCRELHLMNQLFRLAAPSSITTACGYHHS